MPTTYLRSIQGEPERFEARLRQVKTEGLAAGGRDRDTSRQQAERAIRRRWRSLSNHVAPHVSRPKKNHDTLGPGIERGSRLREPREQTQSRGWLQDRWRHLPLQRGCKRRERVFFQSSLFCW